MIRAGRIHSRSMTLSICLFGMFLCLPLSSASAQEHCSPEMNNQAVFLLNDASGNWQSLLEHQKKFVVCDDGELGEGYSDAVVRLFARRWSQFGTFAAIAKKDPAFQHWAIRHIDATASNQDLNKIVHNAAACANDMSVGYLCKLIRQSAENALVESAQMQRKGDQ
ncbi:hypothetical protein ISP15_17895 [Dyella jejuensis]|uniref:Uncharacterized protein n=1 Tax=Dyella jejuensis TaxID=1432009 RepID=A0ABW8JM59_9GAMM